MPGLEADGSLGSSPQQAADVGTQRRRAPFPVLGIMHAHRHARFLYQRAGREAVSIADAASAWEFDADSEDTFDTIDGLLDYGLIEESGIGNMRKIRLTELGWRMADDPDEEEFRRVVCEVAGKPKLIADYAARWREDRPEDKVCIAQLQAEQGFTDELAADFLSCLQESLFHMRFGSPSGQARQRLPPTVAGPPPRSTNGTFYCKATGSKSPPIWTSTALITFEKLCPAMRRSCGWRAPVRFDRAVGVGSR